jgi:hypothetical protein
MMRAPTRIFAIALTLLLSTPAWAQQLTQTDWSGGTGTASSSNLTGETGYSAATGHVLDGAVAGAVRFPHLMYTYNGQSYQITPIRRAEDAQTYYDHQGSGGTPTYPAPPAWRATSRSTGTPIQGF